MDITPKRSALVPFIQPENSVATTDQNDIFVSTVGLNAIMRDFDVGAAAAMDVEECEPLLTIGLEEPQILSIDGAIKLLSKMVHNELTDDEKTSWEEGALALQDGTRPQDPLLEALTLMWVYLGIMKESSLDSLSVDLFEGSLEAPTGFQNLRPDTVERSLQDQIEERNQILEQYLLTKNFLSKESVLPDDVENACKAITDQFFLSRTVLDYYFHVQPLLNEIRPSITRTLDPEQSEDIELLLSRMDVCEKLINDAFTNPYILASTVGSELFKAHIQPQMGEFRQQLSRGLFQQTKLALERSLGNFAQLTTQDVALFRHFHLALHPTNDRLPQTPQFSELMKPLLERVFSEMEKNTSDTPLSPKLMNVLKNLLYLLRHPSQGDNPLFGQSEHLKFALNPPPQEAPIR